MGSYTSLNSVEGITQFHAELDTNPTTDQIAQWITEVEADADAMGIGEYTLTDQLVDVYPKLGTPSVNTIAWLEKAAGISYDEITNLIIIPPFTPVVSISSLSKRTSSLGSTDAWEALTEGTTADTDFIILKKRTKTKKYLGFAVYFHHDNPEPGYQRVKMTYNYGWNLSTDIIGEWCTLKVALKVFQALQEAETPTASAQYAIENTNISLNLDARVALVKVRIEELEDKYFPEKELGIALL